MNSTKGGSGSQPTFYNKYPQYSIKEQEKILTKRKLEIEKAKLETNEKCDFSKWINRDAWRLLEGALLLCDIDPEKFEYHAEIRYITASNDEEDKKYSGNIKTQLKMLEDEYLNRPEREKHALFLDEIKQNFVRTAQARKKGDLLQADELILGKNEQIKYPEGFAFTGPWFEFLVSPYHFLQWAEEKGFIVPKELLDWKSKHKPKLRVRVEKEDYAGLRPEEAIANLRNKGFNDGVIASLLCVPNSRQGYSKNAIAHALWPTSGYDSQEKKRDGRDKLDALINEANESFIITQI